MTTKARAFYLLKKSDKSDFIRLFESDFIRLFKIRSTALILTFLLPFLKILITRLNTDGEVHQGDCSWEMKHKSVQKRFMAPDKPISLINHRQWINYFRNVDFKTPDYKKKFVALAHTMEQVKWFNREHRNNKIQYIQIMVSCAQCTRCNATVLVIFLLTLWAGTSELLQLSLPLHQCIAMCSAKVG